MKRLTNPRAIAKPPGRKVHDKALDSAAFSVDDEVTVDPLPLPADHKAVTFAEDIERVLKTCARSGSDALQKAAVRLRQLGLATTSCHTREFISVGGTILRYAEGWHLYRPGQAPETNVAIIASELALRAMEVR